MTLHSIMFSGLTLMLYEKWVEGWRVLGRFLGVWIAVWFFGLPLAIGVPLVRWLFEDGAWSWVGMILILAFYLAYLPLAFYWASEFSGYLQSAKDFDKLDLPAWKLGSYSTQRANTEQKPDDATSSIKDEIT